MYWPVRRWRDRGNLPAAAPAAKSATCRQKSKPGPHQAPGQVQAGLPQEAFARCHKACGPEPWQRLPSHFGGYGFDYFNIEIGCGKAQICARGLNENIGQDRNGVAPLHDTLHMIERPEKRSSFNRHTHNGNTPVLEQIPAKLHDFADKDLLQHVNLARFLFGKGISPCREAR